VGAEPKGLQKQKRANSRKKNNRLLSGTGWFATRQRDVRKGTWRFLSVIRLLGIRLFGFGMIDIRVRSRKGFTRGVMAGRLHFLLATALFFFVTGSARAETGLQLLKSSAVISKPCAAAPTNARAVFLRYPVIMEGTFNQDKTFNPMKVYKGFRRWTIALMEGDESLSEIQVGKPALVLADYTTAGASTHCGKILYESDQYNNLSYAAILAEAAVYEAERESRISSEKSLDNKNERQGNIYVWNFLKQNGDGLAVLELAGSKVIDIVANSKNLPRKDYSHVRDWRAAKEAQHCAAQGPGVLTPAMHAAVLTLKQLQSDEYALRELGRGLLGIGAYEDAMFTLCGSGAEGLYVAAALKAGRGSVLNGRKFSRVGAVRDADLSGLSLRKLGASGLWVNVNVTGTDFTNANFTNTQFENVNLAEAKLDFAIYDCKTVFPDGFDPTAHHMIPVWRQDGCEKAVPPKVDLSNITVKPFYESLLHKAIPASADAPRYTFSESEMAHIEYDQIQLRRLLLDGLKAKNSVFGRISCDGCKFTNADFSGTRLSFHPSGNLMHFTDTSFKNADLRGSNINAAIFTNVDFTGADLTGINLHRTTLVNVNFGGAKVEDANFKDAKYDAATIFPEGFDPIQAGMIRIIE
jgi:uncharacterized protein YjbI with pentapeptide repeats